MKKKLGLHIGTESIGWALFHQSNSTKIVDIGVRVFSSFITNLGDGEKEVSTATQRTRTRNSRKLYLRKTYRKRKMLSFLAQHGLCPLSTSELAKFYKSNKKSVYSTILRQWYALNPYVLRAKGQHHKLTKHELGRVLYHMTQRRGKLMAQVTKKSSANTLLKGFPSANRLGINYTRKKMDGQKLGEYLNDLLPKKNEPYHYRPERVRNRYLDRKMFQEELDALFDTQQQFHKMITDEFRNMFLGDDFRKGLVFYQRPAQYKKLRGSLATCQFEPTKKAMWLSHPINEWYALYSWLDTIKLYNKKLDPAQRKEALQVALQFSSFMFKKVRIALEVEDPYAFNYQDDTKIQLAHTLVHLTKNNAFGKKFLSFSEEQQADLWHDLFFYTDKHKLIQRLRKKWGLSIPKAKWVASFKLKPGFGSISHKAAHTILRYLKSGRSQHTAVLLAGVQNAIGSVRWEKMSVQKQKRIESFVLDAVSKKDFNATQWIQQLTEQFELSINTAKLYMFQEKNISHVLPVNPTENQQIFRSFKPVVQKPVMVLRRLVNELVQKHGKIDQIKFTLTPELKVNSKNRKTLCIARRIREQELPKIYNAVVKNGQNPTHKNLLKYKLWQEWNKTCPYTNTKITIEDLFTEEVSIVYIQPWERFLNDSDNNKTLCMTFFKEEIASKTPYEYFSVMPSGTWEQVKTRVLQQLLSGTAKHTSYQRFRHFVQSVYAQNSITKEFDDQHNAVLKVKSLLERICPEVVASRGNTISSIRRKWGISSPNTFNNKPRHYNTREAALNAVVVGLNENTYLDELRHWNRYDPLSYRETFPTPWPRFTQDVLSFNNCIPVSVESKTNAVRIIAQPNGTQHSLSPKGKLHKDSYYGKRTSPNGDETFHIRKPITSILSAKQVSKIVDPAVRELVYDQIDLCGGFKNGKVPKKALFTSTPTGWETKVFLPNKRGDKVPVRKVRLQEKVGNAVQLSEGQNKYVNPRNNHHVLVYQSLDGVYQEDVVSFWEAVRRIRTKEPMYQLPKDGRMMIATLHMNDCFILGLSQKEILYRLEEGISLWEQVYRIQRISSKYYEFKHVYDQDIYDQTYPNYVRILNFGSKKTGWLTHMPFKINVNILGEITPFYQPLKVPEMQ